MALTKHLTKQHLLKLLAQAPDDALVVVPDGDHAMRTPQVEVGLVRVYKDGALGEDWGELNPTDDGGTSVPAVILT